MARTEHVKQQSHDDEAASMRGQALSASGRLMIYCRRLTNSSGNVMISGSVLCVRRVGGAKKPACRFHRVLVMKITRRSRSS